MSSLLTNTSAMNALSTLRSINDNLSTTQNRIGTGLKVQSAKDNAAYFSISESMKGDSAMYSAIDEGLTLTKNSLAAARKGSESFQKLAQQFTERVGFSQNATDSVVAPTQGELLELVKQMETIIQQSTFNGDDLVNAGGGNKSTDAASFTGADGKWTFKEAAETTYSREQLSAAETAKNAATYTDLDAAGIVAATPDATTLATINAARTKAGKEGLAAVADITAANLTAADVAAVNAAGLKAAQDTAWDAALTGTAKSTTADRDVVTGISRAGGSFNTTQITVNTVDLKALASGFKAIAEAATAGNIADSDFLGEALKATNTLLAKSISASTTLGQSEKSIENQQEFLKQLTATIDSGVGAMVDADMEEEAARLQALQVQQQLATQALSIANQAPQNLLSLFR